MSDKIRKLQEERANHVKRMREILDGAEADSRDLTSEERSEYGRLETDVEAKAARILDEQRLAKMETELSESASEVDVRGAADTGNRAVESFIEDYGNAFDAYMRFGLGEMTGEQRKILSAGLGTSDADKRDLAKGSSAAGGYLVPTSFQRELYQHMIQAGTMRRTRARVLVTTSGESLQLPKTAGHGTAIWSTEGGSITGTDASFGQITLSSYKAAYLEKISIELLTDNAVNLESYLARQLGFAIGHLENTAYVVGTGSGQPTGISGQASSGKAGATGQTTSVTADDLIDLFYSVGPQYRSVAEWMMNDGTVKAIRKLKDATGQYLWSPNIGANGVLANSAPDTLLGRPLWDDPDMVTMSASAKSILFGDFSAYIIRDVGSAGPDSAEKPANNSAFFVRRLDERFADTGQVGFLCWHRTDGNLLDTTGAVKYYQNSAT